MFAGSAAGLAGGALYSLLLALACVSDLRTRRIPNRLVLVLAVTGLLYSVAAMSFGRGLLHALGGLFVGLLLWLPFYLLRLLGAGDVKLFAAAGAWLGLGGALKAALVSALIGGVLGLATLLWQRKLRAALAGTATSFAAMQQGRWMRPASVGELSHQLPYGVALAAGAVIVGWFPRLFG